MQSAEANGHTCWVSGLEVCGNEWKFSTVSSRAPRCFKEVGGRKLGLMFENMVGERRWEKPVACAVREHGLCELVCPERRMT